MYTAETVLRMTAEAIARERGRWIALIENARDVQRAQGEETAALALDEVAELGAGGSDLYGSPASTEDTDVPHEFRGTRDERAAEGSATVAAGEGAREWEGAAVEEGARREGEDAEEAEYLDALALRKRADDAADRPRGLRD